MAFYSWSTFSCRWWSFLLLDGPHGCPCWGFMDWASKNIEQKVASAPENLWLKEKIRDNTKLETCRRWGRKQTLTNDWQVVVLAHLPHQLYADFTGRRNYKVGTWRRTSWQFYGLGYGELCQVVEATWGETRKMIVWKCNKGAKVTGGVNVRVDTWILDNKW